MPMHEDHYDGGDGWVPGVDFDPSDQDEMEIMHVVWEKEKYDKIASLEREIEELRSSVASEWRDCDGEECEYHGPVKALRHMGLCPGCYNFYRRQDQADAEYEEYAYGRDSE